MSQWKVLCVISINLIFTITAVHDGDVFMNGSVYICYVYIFVWFFYAGFIKQVSFFQLKLEQHEWSDV